MVVHVPVIAFVQLLILAAILVATVDAVALATLAADKICLPLTVMPLKDVLVPLLTVMVDLEEGTRKLVKVPSRIDLQTPSAGIVGTCKMVAAAVLHQRKGAANLCVAVGVLERMQLVSACVVQCSPGINA